MRALSLGGSCEVFSASPRLASDLRTAIPAARVLGGACGELVLDVPQNETKRWCYGFERKEESFEALPMGGPNLMPLRVTRVLLTPSQIGLPLDS